VWLYACGHTFLGTPATAEINRSKIRDFEMLDMDKVLDYFKSKNHSGNSSTVNSAQPETC
jgi:hypothetical protein